MKPLVPLLHWPHLLLDRYVDKFMPRVTSGVEQNLKSRLPVDGMAPLRDYAPNLESLDLFKAQQTVASFIVLNRRVSPGNLRLGWIEVITVDGRRPGNSLELSIFSLSGIRMHGPQHSLLLSEVWHRYHCGNLASRYHLQRPYETLY